MNRQQIRQAARKNALEGQESRRRDRAAKDKRLEALAVDVVVAVAERDEAILEAEQRAGVAVLSMQGEGLSATEVAQWCGDAVGVREIRRFAHGVGDSGDELDASESQGNNPGAAIQEQRAG